MPRCHFCCVRLFTEVGEWSTQGCECQQAGIIGCRKGCFPKGIRLLLCPEVLTVSKNVFSLCKTYTVLSGNRESVDDSSGSFQPYKCMKFIWCCKLPFFFITIKEFQSSLLENNNFKCCSMSLFFWNCIYAHFCFFTSGDIKICWLILTSRRSIFSYSSWMLQPLWE